MGAGGSDPMSIFNDVWAWFTDPANWSGPGGIPTRVLQHLEYTGLALLIATVIAVPVGLAIGHTGRFAFIAINAGNAARSLPTLGLLTLIVISVGSGIVPVITVLALLAIPPILTGTYAGIRAVDRSVVDAARGIGMKERQILFRAEVPMALPIIFSGFRSATLQVVSTATVAAFVGLFGLGRYLIDGLKQFVYAEMFAGAVLVAVLAILLDQLLAAVQRFVVSPGVSRRLPTRRAIDPAALDVTGETEVVTAEVSASAAHDKI